MRLRKRLLAPILLACLALATTAPGAFALTVRYPTQSLGNRGADVKAIQATLISLGYPMAFDGVFGTATPMRVKALPATHGLPSTGIVDDFTWARMLLADRAGEYRACRSGSCSASCIEKMRYKVPVDGVYGTSTKAAVIAFQKHSSGSCPPTSRSRPTTRRGWTGAGPTTSSGRGRDDLLRLLARSRRTSSASGS